MPFLHHILQFLLWYVAYLINNQVSQVVVLPTVNGWDDRLMSVVNRQRHLYQTPDCASHRDGGTPAHTD